MLRDALTVMTAKDTAGSFIPFDCTVITCNLTEKTGGEKLEIKGAVLAGAPFGKKESRKDADHYINGTRNIMIPGRSRPVTIHNLLLIRFNGERVIV